MEELACCNQPWRCYKERKGQSNLWPMRVAHLRDFLGSSKLAPADEPGCAVRYTSTASSAATPPAH